MRPVVYTPFVSAVKTTDSFATSCYKRQSSSELERLGIKVNSITPRGTCEGNGGHLARTCFLIVQVLMNRGWLAGFIGDGVNDYAFAQEGKRRYRCGLLRRDVAASCFQRRHLQSWEELGITTNGRSSR